MKKAAFMNSIGENATGGVIERFLLIFPFAPISKRQQDRFCRTSTRSTLSAVSGKDFQPIRPNRHFKALFFRWWVVYASTECGELRKQCGHRNVEARGNKCFMSIVSLRHYYLQFSFAEANDKRLMIVAVCCTVLNGFGRPVLAIVFGGLCLQSAYLKALYRRNG